MPGSKLNNQLVPFCLKNMIKMSVLKIDAKAIHQRFTYDDPISVVSASRLNVQMDNLPNEASLLLGISCSTSAGGKWVVCFTDHRFGLVMIIRRHVVLLYHWAQKICVPHFDRGGINGTFDNEQRILVNSERTRMSTDHGFSTDGFSFDFAPDSSIHCVSTRDGGELSALNGGTVVLPVEDLACHVECERDRVNWNCEDVKRNEVQAVEVCKFPSHGNDEAVVTAVDASEAIESEPISLQCHCNGGQLFEVVEEGNFAGSILNKWKTFQCMTCNVWYYFHPSDSTGFAVEGLFYNSIGEVKLQSNNSPELEKSHVELNYSERSKILRDEVQMNCHGRNSVGIAGSYQQQKDGKNVNSSAAKRLRRPHKPYSSGIEYTDTENQIIINYLIDNNAILQATGHRVWRDMESKKLLINPRRSQHGMRRHFAINLRYNFRKYTNDKSAIRQFEVLERKSVVKNYFAKLIQAFNSTSED